MLLLLPEPLPDLPLELDALELHALEVAPDDLSAWLRERLGAELLSWTEDATELGWPLALVRAVRSDSGEHLFVGVYRFFHFVGAAAYSGPTAAALDAHARVLREILRRGRPDFRGDALVLISALWESPST